MPRNAAGPGRPARTPPGMITRWCLAAMLGAPLPALAAALPAAAEARVQIVYDARLDAGCLPERGASAAATAWQAELAERLEAYRHEWDTAWPRLRAATEAVTGQPFPARSFTARLTLCDTASEAVPSSDTVIVNMRYALASFTPTPVPLRYKVQTLYHELLHEYLARWQPAASPMLEQQAEPSRRIRNHLHLFALEKAVLLHLGETDVLAQTIAIDSQLPGPYKRAWAIVNASDGEYLRYVAELSRAPPEPAPEPPAAAASR